MPLPISIPRRVAIHRVATVTSQPAAWNFPLTTASLLPAAVRQTGWNCSMDDLLKTGERIANIRQAFNVREDVGIVDFKVPGRISGNPPPAAGPTAGRSVDFTTLRNDYLVARDWDINTSKPSKKKLLELGLDDVAKALWD